MTCPTCHTKNSTDSQRCSVCGSDLSILFEAETLGGVGAASPSPGSQQGSRPPKSIPPRSASRSRTQATGVSGRSSSFRSTLQPGTEFGPRYEIESLLGRGGMGEVYKAFDKELDRTVAIKLVLGDLAEDPEAMQRFKRELLLASKISHKNILRIHDLGDVEGMKFISMAYVEGQDLRNLLNDQTRLPVERALKIGRQLGAALEAAHSEGVVHRDLKPQNILIDREDNIYVSDFGLAKSLVAGAAGMTRTGELLGTPRYMSPEQAQGKPADRRSDLYSLGLILYEMVTGDTPFGGESAFQVMMQRVREKPRDPKLLNPDLPDYLVRVIMRCLEKEPARRYQGAAEILHDLDAQRASLASRSVRVSLPSFDTPIWLLAAAGLVLLLMVLGFSIPSVRNFILHRPAQVATARSGIPTLAQGKYIAVLPFRVLGDQASLNYVAEGLAESISAKLFQLKGVHVASGTASPKAVQSQSLEKIGHELGANLVIRGQLQGGGDKIRIIVDLDSAVDGNRVWSDELTGTPQDLLTLEDNIFTKLSAALEEKPTGIELASAAHPTENIEAYDLYLKGRNAMHGKNDPKNLESAIQYYEGALKKDPSFALAYTGLTDAALDMYRDKKDSFWAQRAAAAAQQAQHLNDNLAEVHFALGSVYDATGKSAAAIAELKRALELAPNSDEGYRRLGTAYLAGGHKDEAIQALKKAIEANPYYWVNQNALGAAFLQLGEYEQALAAFHHVTELEPDNASGYENVGVVYAQQGKYAESIPAFQKALTIQQSYDIYSDLGTGYFFLKRYDDAVKMYEKAVELNPNQQVAVGNLADAYRWSGQSERARATYDKAIGLAVKELQVNPRDANAMDSLALYYAKKGNSAQALEFMRRARSIDRNNVNYAYDQATILAMGGQLDQALKTLQEAFQKGYPPEAAEKDPELKDLQARPEFEKLVKQFSHKAG